MSHGRSQGRRAEQLQAEDPVIVDCAHYHQGKRQHEGKMDLEEAARCAADKEGFVWLGLLEPTEAELADVGRRFGLHELALEDATREHQRPKIEDYDESYFLVLRTSHYDDEKETVNFGEIDVFVGPKYVITVRHGKASELRGARMRVEQHEDLLRYGPAAVVWAVLDTVVDDYEPVTQGLEDDIEEVEQAVFDEETEPTERIYFLKREVIEFHRAVWPLLGPLEALEAGGFRGIPDELRRYFRDVADHARRVNEMVNQQRELLTSVLEANLALVSVRQNEVVKKISSWAAIIGVPTFIASVYGMNFEDMPELNWAAGYPLTLLLMAVTATLLVRFFKRLGWL
jgi:magnesium transporter